MMKTEEFMKAYESCYGRGDASIAWMVYQHSQDNANGYCILGRLGTMNATFGKDVKEIEKKGRFLVLEKKGSEPIANIRVTDRNQAGNILRESNWSIGINDAWVVGGVNSRSAFNFVSDKPIEQNDASLKDFIKTYLLGSPEYPTTVTAREILGLICGGYTAHIVSEALVFMPSSKTMEITLGTYKTNIDNFKGDLLKTIEDYLRPAFQGK